MARLARERIDRETAAAQLRDLRNLAAAIQLTAQTDEAVSLFRDYEKTIEDKT